MSNNPKNLLLSVILEGRFFYGYAVLRQTTRQRERASLCFADYKTTSQRDNKWGGSQNYGITELQNLLLSAILEGRFFYGFAVLRRGLRYATPDYETTSQQDNEWRLRKATLKLRQTTRLLVNKTTSASLRFADNGQQNLGFVALRQTTTLTCSL